MTDADNPWQLRGACRNADPSLFFHPEGERGTPRKQRDAKALTICASCDVILTCRETALAAREPYGIWGGLTETEREKIWKGRPKPAKAAPARVPVQRPPSPNADGRKRTPLPIRRTPPETEHMVRLLTRRGFSGREVAHLCQISQRTVRRILNDASRAPEREQVAS